MSVSLPVSCALASKARCNGVNKTMVRRKRKSGAVQKVEVAVLGSPPLISLRFLWPESNTQPKKKVT